MAFLSSEAGGARRILIRESRSGLAAPFRLLTDDAPFASDALWAIAGAGQSHEAIHAMWTGPEISCPTSADRLPAGIDLSRWPNENETRHPQAGDLVLTRLIAGPPSSVRPFVEGGLDIGVFYAEGGRLFFPEGWIDGTVCARVEPAYASTLREAAAVIRRHGACQLRFEQLS